MWVMHPVVVLARRSVSRRAVSLLLPALALALILMPGAAPASTTEEVAAGETLDIEDRDFDETQVDEDILVNRGIVNISGMVSGLERYQSHGGLLVNGGTFSAAFEGSALSDRVFNHGDLTLQGGGDFGAGTDVLLNSGTLTIDAGVRVLGLERYESIGAPTGEDTGGKIDINTADENLLDELPGIGAVTAGRIVELRDQRGRFQSIDELDDVSRISKATIDKFRDRVFAGPLTEESGAGGVLINHGEFAAPIFGRGTDDRVVNHGRMTLVTGSDFGAGNDTLEGSGAFTIGAADSIDQVSIAGLERFTLENEGTLWITIDSSDPAQPQGDVLDLGEAAVQLRGAAGLHDLNLEPKTITHRFLLTRGAELDISGLRAESTVVNRLSFALHQDGDLRSVELTRTIDFTMGGQQEPAPEVEPEPTMAPEPEPVMEPEPEPEPVVAPPTSSNPEPVIPPTTSKSNPGPTASNPQQTAPPTNTNPQPTVPQTGSKSAPETAMPPTNSKPMPVAPPTGSNPASAPGPVVHPTTPTSGPASETPDTAPVVKTEVAEAPRSGPASGSSPAVGQASGNAGAPAPGALTGNHLAVAEAINRLAALDPADAQTGLLTPLAAIVAPDAYRQALEMLSPAPEGALMQSAWWANYHAVSDLLTPGCDASQGRQDVGYGYSRATRCAWLRSRQREFVRRRPSPDQLRFEESAQGVLMGFHIPMRRAWYGALSLSYEENELEAGSVAGAEGERALLALGIGVDSPLGDQGDRFHFGIAFSGGTGSFDLQRAAGLGRPAAQSSPELRFFSAAGVVALRLGGGRWRLHPELGVGITYLEATALDAPGAMLSIEDFGHSFVHLKSRLTLRGEWNRGALRVGPLLQVGALHFPARNDIRIHAALTPDAPFTVHSVMDDTFLEARAGLEMEIGGSLGVMLGVEGTHGTLRKVHTQGAFLRFALLF